MDTGEGIILKKNITKLLSLFEEGKEDKESDEKINVNAASSGIYFVYEKIRNAVDYREITLIRKNAIERFLKRKLLFTGDPAKLSEQLVQELIKTRYLKNNTLPKSRLIDCEESIRNFLALNAAVVQNYPKLKKEKITDEIVGMMACELDQIIAPRQKDNLFAEFAFEDIRDRSDIESHNSGETAEISIGLYASVLRSLLRADITTIKYYLFLTSFPKWKHHATGILEQTALEYKSFKEIVIPNIKGTRALSIQKTVRKIISPYMVLRNILVEAKESPAEILNDKRLLALKIGKEYEKYFAKSHKSLFSSIFRSIIFIFLTKSLIALLIEIPVGKIIFNDQNLIPIFINLGFPPLYLLLLGFSVRVPGNENEKKIHEQIEKIIYQTNPVKVDYKFKRKREAGPVLLGIFNALYFLTFVSSFGLVTIGLRKLNFNPLDILIFFIFLSTVSFFGVRISWIAKELRVGDEKRGFLLSILDFMYTPFMKMGQWISDTYSKVNLFTFILDFLIEAPLKSILEIFEAWSKFIKEKQEDII